MKKFKILSLLLLSVVFVNCSISDGQKSYNGDNALFFGKGATQKVILDGSEESVTLPIEFSTVAAPKSSYEVKLVLDAENSTAVEGVDFDFVTDVVTVESGVLTGAFSVRYYDAPSVTEGKKAVFTLESATIDTAVFKNTLTVTITKSCQIDLATFPLMYDVEVYAFSEQAPSHQQTFTVVSGQENTFKVNSMWGPNFVAWATGSASYEGQFVYPANIVINCDNTVDVETTGTQFLGGSGTYDPETGIIDVVITQGVFTSPFDTQVIFYPVQ
ncbi:hypothetical protein [Flavobacterium sp.]|uniref:hypothetical protein n=1 Tax=Flavobacterium sp. TaxID=239 RepID=UPI00262775FB|nr:hypothetical protein [Flavobacterium sp.]MDD3004476.1 hypothetical protein [Flavobacterium sp.]